MNFLSYIINKFKKKDYNIGIMRFGDNIVIPGREYFKEDKQIELLEEYKKHYLEELNKRNVVTTLNFNSNELKQDMNMNVDIILRMLMDNEDFYRLAPEELIIQSLKLRMYYEEISKLEEETILRLVALKEIEKSKKVPRRSRMALEEEANQLSVILEMYSYRKSAISIELKNYIDTLSTRELTIDDDVLKQRLDNLLFISYEICDKEKLDKYSDTKVKIAILERECERYVYLNKDKVEKLKEDINRVIQLGIDDSNKNDLINTCTSLENKLLLFYYYGNHLVGEEDLRKLYEFKFKVLTYDIYSLNSSPIKKNDNGYSYYGEIIEKKIEDIIKGENEIFNNKFKEEDRKKIIEYFINFYLDENKQFNYDDILIKKIKLSLLLSFDTENGLNDFYDKTRISDTGFYIENLGPTGITFDGSASLTVLCEFSGLKYDSLYLIYKSIDIPKYADRHIFPEGIVSFDFYRLTDIDIRKKFIDLFNTDSVFIPSTMKSMVLNDLLSYTKTKKIIFENGIENISITCCNRLNLILPPSLVKFETSSASSIFANSEIINLDLTFYNYEDSKLLHNERGLLGLLKSYERKKYDNNKIQSQSYFEKRVVDVRTVFYSMTLVSKTKNHDFNVKFFDYELTDGYSLPSKFEEHTNRRIDSHNTRSSSYNERLYEFKKFRSELSNRKECEHKIVSKIVNYVYRRTNHILIPELVKLDSKEENAKKLVR